MKREIIIIMRMISETIKHLLGARAVLSLCVLKEFCNQFHHGGVCMWRGYPPTTTKQAIV